MEEIVPHLIAFATLALLEIVLGIDNVIFITILASKLPEAERSKARRLGIGLAVVSRIVLLFGISWVMRLTEPILNVAGNGLSGQEIILIIGGLFLIGKSTAEIHDKIEAADTRHATVAAATANLATVLVQVLLVDVIFSLDSVITAVGISGNLPVMISAIVLAAVIMVVFADRIGNFVEKHPTMKILALAFLILIGVLLVIEGWAPDQAHELHLKNYAYFAMAFSLLIELINIRVRKSQPVTLHNRPHLTPEVQEEIAKTTVP
jgi:predicted tellurium resistance membrane protein TerC